MNRALPLIGILVLLSACTKQAQPLAVTQQASSAAEQEASSVVSSAPVAMMRFEGKKSSSSPAIQEKKVQHSPAKGEAAWNRQTAMTAMPATKEEWLKIISEDSYAVLFEEGTERPFTSPLLDEHRKGTFVSADCGEPVFRSEQKFDSGTGWPSFWAPISPDAVIEKKDTLLGYERTEIKSKCGGHLGHVFTDGPQPTGLRYCMNGVALRFIPD